jgi:hypothetical protein
MPFLFLLLLSGYNPMLLHPQQHVHTINFCLVCQSICSATTLCCTPCSYCVSAKTGRGIKSTFLCIAADLAGVPLTQQQIAAAAAAEDDGIKPTGHMQQLQVDLQQLPGPLSPAVGSAGLRSRKHGGCSDARACSVTPKQQDMQRTEQQEEGDDALQEEQDGTTSFLGNLQTCRCCCQCVVM